MMEQFLDTLRDYIEANCDDNPQIRQILDKAIDDARDVLGTGLVKDDMYKLMVQTIDEVVKLDKDDIFKYESLQLALPNYSCSNVLISVGKTYYIFKKYSDYEQFEGELDDAIKKNGKLDKVKSHLAMYHVIPADAIHNPMFVYNSVKKKEIAVIKKHISKTLDTPEDLIQCIPKNEDQSYLRLNGIQGTYNGYCTEMLKCIMKADDTKLKLPDPQQCEGVPAYIYPLLNEILKYIKLNKSVNIKYLIMGNVGGNAGDIHNGSPVLQKKSKKEIAEEWIKANKPAKKHTPTEYYNIYLRDTPKRSMKLINFNIYMKELGYEVGKSHGSRYWRYVGAKDSDGDESDDD